MSGIIADYLDIISKKTGIIFQLETAKNWQEVKDQFEQQKTTISPSIDYDMPPQQSLIKN